MEKKINIAELLKDCPQGMELDCTICNNVVTLERVDGGGYFPIRVMSKDGYHHILTCEGCAYHREDAKCVIFPKGKTTWEGFVPPCQFKVGDVVVNATNEDSNAFIYAGEDDECYYRYVGLSIGTNPELCTDKSYAWVSKKSGIRFATEEEKHKLFDAIKANGYKWNAGTKTLEKLVEPKFKVGDVIQDIDTYKVKITEVSIEDECYGYESMIAKGIGSITFSEQDNWELVPNKFDISTLKPFDKVLVRDKDDQLWTADIFSFKSNNIYPFACVGHYVNQCIPYEENKHLLGTTDDCDDYYNTWE